MRKRHVNDRSARFGFGDTFFSAKFDPIRLSPKAQSHLKE